MATPDVTVIVGAYNAMPYMTRCIESVVGQTIGPDRMEVIAVDDGSTDGTGEELDRLAVAHPGLLRVIHQENSGGPSAPRNVGLDLARGRFVFFLDADDYLGPEALERMVAMADANGSDVVLGKMVGIGGRGAPVSMFRGNQPRADLFTSRVYWTLSPLKLYRRALIERLGLRFRTDLRVGEDQPFTAAAYLHASAISVVADYDCYYWVEREDGNNITRSTRGTEARLRFVQVMLDFLAEHVPAGPGRDHLLLRHFDVDLRRTLGHLSEETDPALRDAAFAWLRGMVTTWYSDALAARLPAIVRLQYHLVQHGMLDELLVVVRFDRQGRTGEAAVTVDEGRAYAAYPYFRDPRPAIPDELYDITGQLPVRHRLDSVTLDSPRLRISGHAYLHHVDTRDMATEVVLRRRDGKVEHRFPAEPAATPELTDEAGEGRYNYGKAGYTCVIDLTTAVGGAPLPEGVWDAFVEVEVQGVRKQARTGSRRTPRAALLPRPRILPFGDDAATIVTPYYTHPYGNLSLDIGEKKHRLTSRMRVERPAWAPDTPATLLISGHLDIGGLPPGSLYVRATGPGGQVRDLPVPQDALTLADDGGFTARIRLDDALGGRLPSGEWTLALRVAVRNRSWTVPLPAHSGLTPRRWRHGLLPVYAKPVSCRDSFTLCFGAITPSAWLRRYLRRLR